MITGQTREEEALEFIREHEPPDGWFVAFSGGKDSVVLLDLVRRANVKHEAWYSATGIDPPELVRFIQRHYPGVRWARPRKSFYAFIPEKGFPTRGCRWCCDHLKKIPTKKNNLRQRLTGVRAEESSMRAKRSRIEWVKTPVKQRIFKPIFYWLEWEIWQYIEDHGLPYCSLYDEGFDRIGCVVCPFLCGRNQTRLNQHRDRWPKQYKAFDIAMRKLWTRKQLSETGFDKTFEDFLEAWYLGLSSKRDIEDLPLFKWALRDAA